ncbi:hypothetical protein BH10PLA2_BH10PLA2_32040 [soil metagenome]
MNHLTEEEEVVGKLAVDWHLNVPDRRKLPNGRVQASLLLDAIERELHANTSYPRGLTPDTDFSGGLVLMSPQGNCRILWKTQISTSQFEANWSTEEQTPRDAAETLIRSLFGAEIDGIPIDWQS